MAKKLAIKGHPTRGNEIIKLLKMLGGANPFSNNGYVIGNKESSCYYVYEDTATKYISWDFIGPEGIDKYEIFTLEEFLEKYPFKIGDFVNIPEYESEVRICNMKWDGFEIKYMVYSINDEEEWYTSDELLDCNDIDMNTGKDTVCDAHKKIAYLSINNEDYADQIEVDLSDNYEYKFEMNRLYILKKKPKYPKTYEECCGVLGMTYDYPDIKMVSIDECSLYSSFIELIRCRDAYWKIAGEQMRLDKPWKPDWNHNTEKYVIYPYQYLYSIDKENYRNTLLAFPTEEMRDIFYDNFKDLIEKCKELL